MNIMNSAVLKLPQHNCTNTGIQHWTERARSCSLSSASPLQIHFTSVEQLLFQERQLIKMSEVSGQDPVCSQDWRRITAQHLSQIKGTVVVLVSGNAMYRVKMYWLQNSWWVLMSLKKGLIAETFFNVFIKFLLFNTPWSLWRSTYQHNHRLIHLSIHLSESLFRDVCGCSLSQLSYGEKQGKTQDRLQDFFYSTETNK